MNYYQDNSATTMKTAALVIALIHFASATLLIKGPSGPILERETFEVECLLQDSEYNPSDVHFQYFNPSQKVWTEVPERFKRRMFPPPQSFHVYRTEDRVHLTARAINGLFSSVRCVIPGTNSTDPEYSSEPLNLSIHYLYGPYLSRDGSTGNLWYRPFEDLSVRAGADVVGSDWILPLSVLTLKKVSAMDEGQYTCSAEHPSIPSLSRKYSFILTVLPDFDAGQTAATVGSAFSSSERASWFQSTDEQMMLVTILVPVATCLLLILVVSVFLYRRSRKILTSRGPIDDHSQIKPILV